MNVLNTDSALHSFWEIGETVTRITFVLFVLCFLLFRPYQLHNTGMLYGNGYPQCDDNSYMAHALALSSLEFPNYTKQVFVGGEVPMHAIGSGLLVAPFVGFASLLDRFSNDSAPRTYDVLRKQWVPFGFFFATVFYFWIACWILYDSARRVVSERAASWSVILLVLFQGVPLVAFRRPIFSHTYELLAMSAMVWLFVRWRTGEWPGPSTNKGALLLGAMTGLLCLIRYNNVPLAGAWLLLFFVLDRQKTGRIAWRQIFISGAVVMILLAIFKLLPTLMLGREKYAIATGNFIRPLDVEFIIRRLIHILIGIDWGLIFTAPFLLIGLYGLFRANKADIESPLRWLLPVFSVNLYLVIMLNFQGGFYGYRYLVHSLFPLALLPLARIIDRTVLNGRKWVLAVFCLTALITSTSMLFYEGNSTTLTLQSQRIEYPEFDYADWDNKTYQVEVWKTLISPRDAAVVLSKGGPAFLAYQTASVLKMSERLPVDLLTRYEGSGKKLILQTFAIWGLPWFLWGFWYFKNRKKHSNQYQAGA